jgi:phosphinothricin acetyltransferase
VQVRIRPATLDDIPSIQAIYAHHVALGLGSFEEQAPPVEEMRRRFHEIAGGGFPYLVAEFGDAVLGYGYCTLYRTRSAYRYAVEDSVYVRHDSAGRGVGKALLADLIVRCEALGYRQIIAVIGDSANAGSIGLHASQGFLRAGTLRSVGFKLGRWVDSVFMQRPLGDGDGLPPAQAHAAPKQR